MQECLNASMRHIQDNLKDKKNENERISYLLDQLAYFIHIDLVREAGMDPEKVEVRRKHTCNNQVQAA